MSEISLKSPHFKQREIDYVNLLAKVTIDDSCCGVNNAIDIPGISVAVASATSFTLSGFEVESGVSLDEDRSAGLSIKATGTVTGATDAEIGSLTIVSGVITDPTPLVPGSRIVTFIIDSAAAAVDLTSDALTDAVLEFSLPIKAKDF